MKHIEEGAGELVVAGCDGAVDLEVADHPLDAVALAIEQLVPGDVCGAVRARWDDGADAVGDERVADRIAVVAFVSQQGGGFAVGQRAQRFELRAVGRFAAREMEGEREALGITETVNFTGEPAPRAAKSLVASPPFAPAAETCPRTVVESML